LELFRTFWEPLRTLRSFFKVFGSIWNFCWIFFLEHTNILLHGARKDILFGVKKVKISLQSQKRNLGPNIKMVVWYIHQLGILHGARTHILFGVKNVKISLQSPKTEFGPQIPFLTPKSIFFLASCKIPNRWIYHTTILILGPKFRLWATNSVFGLCRPFDFVFRASFRKKVGKYHH
jgi:hypothetical protein